MEKSGCSRLDGFFSMLGELEGIGVVLDEVRLFGTWDHRQEASAQEGG